MPRPTTPEVAYARSVVAPWRVAFVLYALAVTVGTHWPRLRLGPEVPATDKMIHLVAFGGFTLLLWRTRWIRHVGVLFVVCAAWSALDEVSQGLPVLNRFVSWYDIVANTLGVVTVVAWVWALGPVGGAVNRRRLALDGVVLDRLFMSWWTWLMFAGVFFACVLPVAMLWSVSGATTIARMIVLALVVWVGGSAVLFASLWQRARRLVLVDRPCSACGTAALSASFDDDGGATCAGCARPLRLSQWTPHPPPLPRTQVTLATAPIVGALTGFVLLFGVIVLLPVVHGRLLEIDATSGLATQGARLFGQLPATLHRTLDVAALLLITAPAVRVYRVRLARYHDRGMHCRRCGHDLRGTPVTDAIGRCGECGMEFQERDAPTPAPTTTPTPTSTSTPPPAADDASNE